MFTLLPLILNEQECTATCKNDCNCAADNADCIAAAFVRCRVGHRCRRQRLQRRRRRRCLCRDNQPCAVRFCCTRLRRIRIYYRAGLLRSSRRACRTGRCKAGPRDIADFNAAALPLADRSVLLGNDTGRICRFLRSAVIVDSLIVFITIEEIRQLSNRHMVEVIAVDVAHLFIIANLIPCVSVRTGDSIENHAKGVIPQLCQHCGFGCGLRAEIHVCGCLHIAVRGRIIHAVRRLWRNCNSRRCRDLHIFDILHNLVNCHEPKHIIADITPFAINIDSIPRHTVIVHLSEDIYNISPRHEGVNFAVVIRYCTERHIVAQSICIARDLLRFFSCSRNRGSGRGSGRRRCTAFLVPPLNIGFCFLVRHMNQVAVAHKTADIVKRRHNVPKNPIDGDLAADKHRIIRFNVGHCIGTDISARID